MGNRHAFKAALCAAVLALCAAPAGAQEDGGGGGNAAALAAIPQMPFHLVEGFFKYPAHMEVGRLSGIAVGPKGNIVVLNRGYHPVMEFKPDGSFSDSWGEGSTMFVGAHSVRFDPQGDLWYIDSADDIIYRFDAEGRTIGTLGTEPESWTWLTHVIEHAAPRQRIVLPGNRYRLEQGRQQLCRRRLWQFAGGQVRQGRQFRQSLGRARQRAGRFQHPAQPGGRQ